MKDPPHRGAGHPGFGTSEVANNFFTAGGREAEDREDPLVWTEFSLPRRARTPGKAGFKGGDAAGDSAA